MVRMIAVALLASSVGCMVPCGDEGRRIAGLRNSGYCARREAEVSARQRQREDVADCVHQGGDPAGCRAAVYGRDNSVNVQIGPR